MVASIATMMERVRNTPGLARDVLLLTICASLGLTCALYILGKQDVSAPWTDKYTFAAEFDKAPAVRPQSMQEVRIAGVKVGRITGAEPTKNGNARVEFSIDPEHRVYKDARVVIRTKSPLNVMYATLDPGTPAAGPLGEGATIPITQTDRAIQPNELLDQLDTKARAGLTALLNEADIAMAADPTALGEGLGATKDAMLSFQPVLEQLEKRRQNIRRLVTSFSSIAAAVGDDRVRLAALTADSHNTLAALAKRDAELDSTLAQLPGLTDDLQSSMKSVDYLSSELDPTLTNLTNASEELPDALEDLSGTVGAIRKFVRGAKPVVDKAGPVVSDLRPLARELRAALANLSPVTDRLPRATKRLVPWMDSLAAFTYNTSSSFSLYDANGGMGRAVVNVDLTNPSGGLQDEGIPGYGAQR